MAVMLPRVTTLLVCIIGSGFAQSTCPAVNFQQARTINLKPSSNTHVDVVRQDDASYTGYETTDTSPYRVIAITPHFEKQFGQCLPHKSPAIPLAPRPAANPSGAGSQLQVSTRLPSGNLFVGSVSSDGATIRFDIFDSSHNLLSETRFSYQVNLGPGFRSDRFVGLSLADVNGDGIPDLVASFDSNRILAAIEGGVWIFPGNSDGTFGSGTRMVLATNTLLRAASGIAIADVNGDGKPDIAFGHPYGSNGDAGGSMIIALGNGDGTFKAVTGGLTGVESLALGDLNGDGIPDLVSAATPLTGSGLSLVVVLGDSSGTFRQTPQTYVVDFGQVNPGTAMVAIGDLNGDGIPDIATSGGTILFGDGKGGFPTRAAYSSNASGSVMIGDVDGDGIADLIYGNGDLTWLSGNSAVPTTTVLFGEGHGIFAGAPISQTGLPDAAQFATDDFNGDGIPDVVFVITTGTSTQVSFLAGTGDGRFSTPKTQMLPYLSGSGAAQVISAQVTPGDFNRDGIKDIIVFSGRGSPIQIYLGNNDGTFRAAPGLTLPNTDLTQIGTPDFNGDGIPDLIAWGASALYVCLGKGDGTFGQPVSSRTVQSPNVGWGDFNGDGKIDIVTSDSGSSTLLILAGKGDGTFSANPPIRLPFPAAGSARNLVLPTTIPVADFDRDGRQDIAILLGPIPTPAGQPQYLTEVLSGAGDGTFSASHFTAGVFYGAIPVDINRDGIPDLVGIRDTFPETLQRNGSGVSVRLGNGDGTFQPDVIADAAGVFSVSDLNRDGAPDLATADSGGVAAFLNLSKFVPLTVVSAAGFIQGPLAPGAFAAAFGAGLTRTSGAPAVLVQDSAGVLRLAQVYFASSTQINFRVPPGTATGSATVTVAGSSFGTPLTAQVQIVATAPSLFTVGADIAAAYAVQVTAGVATTVPVFSASAESITAIPLPVSPGDTYLVLYGTGLDAATASNTTANVQGIPCIVTYAGPQPGIPGLDQINVLLPATLAGTGAAKVSITVNGATSNLVGLVIQ